MTGVLRGTLIAGGASRRMGAPKASLQLAGRPLAHWAASSLAMAASETFQVGGDPIAGLGWPVWPDLRAEGGPAGGLEAALANAGTVVIVCAVDTPFVPAALLRLAFRFVRSGAIAAIPRWRGRWHPLCGAYAPDTLPVLRARLDAGVLDLHGLLDAVAAWPLREATLRAFGEPQSFLLNVNSPADMERARRLARHGAGAAATG